MSQTRRIYATVGTRPETCPFGDEHDVAYCVVQEITPTGETVARSNGYGNVQERVATDHQGREYVSLTPIDYHGRTSWSRLEDGLHFDTDPPGSPADSPAHH